MSIEPASTSSLVGPHAARSPRCTTGATGVPTSIGNFVGLGLATIPVNLRGQNPSAFPPGTVRALTLQSAAPTRDPTRLSTMAPAASKLVVKKKKGDDDVDPTLKRIAALFELEKAIQDGTLTPNDERLAQTEFWSAMRSILAVNELTSGVGILDDIAAALISG
ncbi:hypothetical protein PR003_g19656 [Phytophthora rubi]|uniref:Uncharacterized protein n=1 Tax=Phytophthora rubi TaxID=129364 RepID=A0A6A3JDP6_9STRA|nr:hypothetical protein PR002_g20455 [Phytophthora rubi]KAE9312879.1 hypothetical protein PR003_g19656 [Phytophthora rubi]